MIETDPRCRDQRVNESERSVFYSSSRCRCRSRTIISKAYLKLLGITVGLTQQQYNVGKRGHYTMKCILSR